MNGVACALVGRIGTEPELKHTTSGQPMLSFSVAVQDARAEQGAPAEWIRVTAWGGLAESLDGYLGKGAEVYVEGRLRLSQWQAQDGTPRAGLSVSAWLVQPLGQIGRRKPQQPERPSGNGLAGRRADRDAARARAGSVTWPGEAG
ncbi:MAG: single-stranded DNA-binding protein [Chloroflexi bacterium]|nr:single-stranded DNA-binding protein [Chloroflexota bacterium]